MSTPASGVPRVHIRAGMTAAAPDMGLLITKAVVRRRQLAQKGNLRLEANLARILEVLADHSIALRAWDDALAALEEAVSVTRVLAAADPEAFLKALGARLLRLSIALYEAGNIAGAITTAREAAGLYRRLVAEQPEAVGSDFVHALKHLSCGLAVSGDAQAALAAMREAVAAHRKLNASLGSGEETFCLPWNLGLLGMRLRLAGNIEEARAVTAEAIALLGDSGRVPESVRHYLCREYDSLDAPPACPPPT